VGPQRGWYPRLGGFWHRQQHQVGQLVQLFRRWLRSDRGRLQREVNFGELVVSTNGGLRLPFSRRPRESGGPGLQAPCPPPWMPAFAGMTVRWVGAER
jgi:hypothetical protein